MKKLILSFIIISLFSNLYAQQHKVELYPTSLIFQEITMEYEFIPKTTILGVGAQITGAMKATEATYSGIMFAPFLKLYFTSDATRKLNAWYVKPTFYIGSFRAENEMYFIEGKDVCYGGVSFNPMGVSLMFGKQWTFSSGFSIDLAFGPRYISQNNIPHTIPKEVLGENLSMFGLREWVKVGPGRFWDAQLGLSYVFPVSAKK